MDENKDLELNEANEFDDFDNIIVLNDEDGNEVEFEYLDAVEMDGTEYIILLPT